MNENEEEGVRNGSGDMTLPVGSLGQNDSGIVMPPSKHSLKSGLVVERDVTWMGRIIIERNDHASLRCILAPQYGFTASRQSSSQKRRFYHSFISLSPPSKQASKQTCCFSICRPCPSRATCSIDPSTHPQHYVPKCKTQRSDKSNLFATS